MAFQPSMFLHGGSRAGAAADAYWSSNCSRALLAAAALGAGGAIMGGAVATSGSSSDQLTIGNLATTFTNTTTTTNNNNPATSSSLSSSSTGSSSSSTTSLAAATGASDRMDDWTPKQEQEQQQQHNHRSSQLSKQQQLSAAAAVASHHERLASALLQHRISCQQKADHLTNSDLSDLDTDVEDFDEDRQQIDELIDEFEVEVNTKHKSNNNNNTSESIPTADCTANKFNCKQQQQQQLIKPAASVVGQHQQLATMHSNLQRQHQVDENSLSNESILSLSDNMDTAPALNDDDDDENQDDGDEDNSDRHTGGSRSNNDHSEAMAEQEMALNLSVHKQRDQRNINQQLLLNTFNPFIKAAASAVAAAAATSQGQQRELDQHQHQQQEVAAFFARQQQQQQQQQRQGQLQMAASDMNNLSIQSLSGANTTNNNHSSSSSSLEAQLNQQQQLQQASNRLYQHIQQHLGAATNVSSTSGASLAAALAASQQKATAGLACNGPLLSTHLHQRHSQTTTAAPSTPSSSTNNSPPLSATFAHLLQATHSQNGARHGLGHHHQASSSGSSSYHSHSSSASSTSSLFSSVAGTDNRFASSCSPERSMGGTNFLSSSSSPPSPQALPLPSSCPASASTGLTLAEPHQLQASEAQARLHQQLLKINFNDIHHNQQLNPFTTSTNYHQRSQATMNQSNSQQQQEQHLQQQSLSAHRTLFFNAAHHPTHHPHHANHLHPAAHLHHHQHELGPVHKADSDDLDRIRNFIEQFKARRGALGLTQKQAAQCFRAYTNDRYAFSDNFVGHFEGFQFRPQTAMTIADSLAEWLEYAENETRQGRQLSFMPGKVKETRKRKYEVIRIRDSAKRMLVEAFEKNRSPSTSELEQLSKRTNIPSRNIEIFFKNRRTSRQYHH